MKRLLLGLLLLGSASAAELRIYPSFGEVRDAVRLTEKRYTISLPEGAYGQVVNGTLDLEGVDVLARTQRLRLSWLASQEGKQVTLREEGRTERVTLVRASDLMVRDASGQFRTVRFEQLAFDVLPPENPGARTQEVTFDLAAPGNATLSYLTRAVSWTPRYTLKLSGSVASLSGLAEIRNNSDQPYAVTTGELIAGDVNLFDNPIAYDKAETLQNRAAPAAAPAPGIGAGAEGRGLYRYPITSAFTLAANSSLTLPFVKPKVTFERFAGLLTGFNAGPSKGKLNRNYRVKSDVLLPSGPITVRDEGRIVGQSVIGDTSANDPIELNLGADPDVSFTRAVQVVRQDKTSAVYRVTLTLENDKDRSIRAEVRESIGGNYTVEGGAEKVADGLLVRVDLPSKGKVTRTYTVTFRYGP